MAKYTIKGKKITGTKKKDKIVSTGKDIWNKAFTVNAGKGNDIINFKKSKNKNTLNGQAGKDTIFGGSKDDKITGGTGNDQINAGKGKNTLYFSKGDGTDTVLNGSGTDTLIFKTEKNINNIKVAYSGNNAIVTYTGGSVILKDYKKGHSAKYIKVGNTKKSIADFLKPTPTPKPPIVDGYYVIDGTNGNDNLLAKDGYNCKLTGFAGNDTINGGAGNDKIYGTSGDNILNGGDGNDSIYAGSGNDTINAGFGDNYIDVTNGANTIVYDNAYLKPYRTDTIANLTADDTICFSNVGIDAIWKHRYDEDNNYLIIGSNNLEIKILDYSQNSRDGYVKFGDNDPIKISELIVGNHPYSGEGDLRVYDDTANLFKNMEIRGKIYTRGGNDTINSINSDGHDLYINTGAGDDSIVGLGSYANVDTDVYTGDGNDYISANYLMRTHIYGGAGNDTISAKNGHKMALIYGEDGNDSIEGGQNMYGGNGNDIIIAYHHKDNDEHSAYLDGGAGDDELRRGGDTNTDVLKYQFDCSTPNGNDIIYDNLYGKSKLDFSGNSQDCLELFNSMIYIKDVNDLIIKYKDKSSNSYENNSITIKDFLTSANQGNLYIADGSNEFTVLSKIDKNGYCGQVITGTEGNDTLNGTADNDTITGGDGDDTIYTGKGNDQIYAGSGDDFIYAGRGNDEIHAGAGKNTMVFYNRYYFDGSNKYDNANDGNDIVYTNGGGVDTLDFGQSIAVKYEKSDNDLIIQYNFDPTSYWAAKSTVTLKDFYDSTVNNSTQYIKLLGQDAIELKPEELTEGAISKHNSSITFTTGSLNYNDSENYTAYGNNNTNILQLYNEASGTYFFDGGFGENDVYQIGTLNAKTIIYDSGNDGYVNVYVGKLSGNNVFYDMQVTVENGVVTACDYNALQVYATGLFDKGVSVLAKPNLAGVTDGTPTQSIPVVQDGYSNKLTDISGLAQATAAWVAENKETGVYSTAGLVSAGGDDAAAILAIAAEHIDWQYP